MKQILVTGGAGFVGSHLCERLLEEGNSMGAAVIGGIGAGLYKDFTAIDRFIEVAEECTPDPAAVEASDPLRPH